MQRRHGRWPLGSFGVAARVRRADGTARGHTRRDAHAPVRTVFAKDRLDIRVTPRPVPTPAVSQVGNGPSAAPVHAAYPLPKPPVPVPFPPGALVPPGGPEGGLPPPAHPRPRHHAAGVPSFTQLDDHTCDLLAAGTGDGLLLWEAVKREARPEADVGGPAVQEGLRYLFAAFLKHSQTPVSACLAGDAGKGTRVAKPDKALVTKFKRVDALRPWLIELRDFGMDDDPAPSPTPSPTSALGPVPSGSGGASASSSSSSSSPSSSAAPRASPSGAAPSQAPHATVITLPEVPRPTAVRHATCPVIPDRVSLPHARPGLCLVAG